ncbi:restriction endonuclease [Ramlibacter henchirensis]|uniref:Restriction endonuclease n=1 Tax=Ramlibacter henchirensis TaxID=204072 RepID=A0A4Z0BUY5_9BURK|nr:restriction endonuclease [Ramlibacter henchirensis]TFZ02284.1 restriction endonuclease [Ramlibacter henchirensis]
MGRRRRSQSVADDFVEVVALLPWWGGVVLALVFYLLLHRMAMSPSAVASPGQVGQLVTQTLLATFASVGQYFVPFLCLVAALISFIGRRRREDLVIGVAAQSVEALNGISWKEFELLVGEAFRLQGYSVLETGAAGPDGGVDLVLRKGTETSLVQCKQWKATQVGVQVVRELFGVMAARGATAGFVVTSGRFSSDARAFAEGRNIRLVDGPKLFGLIEQARRSLAEARPAAVGAPREMSGGAPQCPKCNAAMVRRTARTGPHAGSQFWGCSTFPKCRATR